jgi:hypothetical protein
VTATLKVVSVPLDTTLLDEVTREFGFRDCAHARQVDAEQRAAMDPHVRELCDQIEEKLDRAFLVGS